MTEYETFLEGKIKRAEATGFEPLAIHNQLFEWQKLVVRWAVKRGKAALFESCGLGKTGQQLEWASQVAAHTGGNVLILCPLAVAEQTVAEGLKFDVAVNHCRHASDVRVGVNVTNYGRLHLFDGVEFSGVVLDESSCLKCFTGKLRKTLTERFANTPYRLCCTATPSPNDWTELGQHAEFLGICTPAEMLATYFINDTFDTGTWRLKGHAKELFWRWVSSWAACISTPSDIGFPDDGYILPPVVSHVVTVAVDHRAAEGSEDLFRMPGVSATNIHAELRRTMNDRVNAAVEIANASDEQFIVWCYGNDESAMLTRLINGAVELTGSDKDTVKEDRIAKFLSGKARVLVSKPSIAGSGLNLQCCRNDIYVGLTHSFEQFYQSSKRIHRFGQTREVRRWIIQTDTEDGVMATIMRKQDQHDTMRSLMKFTRETLMEETTFTQMKTDITLATGEDWQLYHGDCVRVARDLPDESVGFSVFSPPFADVFCYSNDIQDMGNCNGLSDFMVQFGYLIEQLSRITMPGRHCAVHCCDLLSTKWKDGEIGFKGFIDAIERAFCGDPNDIISQVSSALTSSIVEKFKAAGWVKHSQITIWKDPVTEMQRTKAHGLLYKTLRTDSSKSRVGSPDYLLIFRKKGDNPVPITHTPESFPLDLWQEIASPVWMTIDQGKVLNGKLARDKSDERHICPLQIDVIERALTMWSAKGDTVFSPFTGIGSEGYCSLQMGRKFIGAELKESYWKTACRNLSEAKAEQSLF